MLCAVLQQAALVLEALRLGSQLFGSLVEHMVNREERPLTQLMDVRDAEADDQGEELVQCRIRRQRDKSGQ